MVSSHAYACGRHKMIKATMKPTDCYINAGVYLLDVTRYRDAKVNKRIAKLIEERNRRGKTLWKTGVHQPSFILGTPVWLGHSLTMRSA
eukprot:scaffold318_cov396-Prasinococcus_capsulatus_cf.AAC.24